MILHQGDRYVCNGTQVHPGSLNFLKSSLEIGVPYEGHAGDEWASKQLRTGNLNKNSDF